MALDGARFNDITKDMKKERSHCNNFPMLLQGSPCSMLGKPRIPISSPSPSLGDRSSAGKSLKVKFGLFSQSGRHKYVRFVTIIVLTVVSLT